MRKWTKRILAFVGILFLLLILAVILIPILFSDKIEAAVKDEVNKNINATVNWGEWDISLLKNFPNLTVDIADVKVTNLAPFEGIDLEVVIMPVIQLRLMVRSLPSVSYHRGFLLKIVSSDW